MCIRDSAGPASLPQQRQRRELLHQRAHGREGAGLVPDTPVDASVAARAAAGKERCPGMPISLVAGNAGIGDSGSVFETPDAQYQRILGINVFGVANTLRHFVPTMIAQEEPGIVVSTASLMGIVILVRRPAGLCL